MDDRGPAGLAGALGLAALLLGAGTFAVLHDRAFDGREALLAVEARALLGGERPSGTGDASTPPGAVLAGAAALAVSGGSPLGLRAAVALLHLATALVLLRWVAPREGRGVAFLAAATYVAILPAFQGWEYRPEPFEMLFVLASALLLLGADAGARPRLRLAVCGAFLGLAILFKQPVVAFVPAMAAARLVSRTGSPWRSGARSALLADAGAFLSALAAVVGVAAVYFAACGAFHDFVLGAWTANVHGYPREGRGLAANLWSLASAHPLLAVAIVAGLPRALAPPGRGEDAGRFLAGLLFLAALLPFHLRPYPYYFLAAAPFAALIAAPVPARLLELLPDRPWTPLDARVPMSLALASAVLAAPVVGPATSLWEDAQSQGLLRSVLAPSEPAAFVRDRTSPDDLVLFYRYAQEVAYFADRRGLANNAGYMWEGFLYDMEELLVAIDGGAFAYGVLDNR